MKIKLILFLLSLTIAIKAQQPFEIYKPIEEPAFSKPIVIIGVFAAQIGLQAAGDALKDSGHKEWGHTLNAMSVGVLLMSPIYLNIDPSKWVWYLASYVSLRIAIFDYAYNAVRGLPLNYIGGTSLWDKTLQELNPPTTTLGRAVFLTVGISIPINKLK